MELDIYGRQSMRKHMTQSYRDCKMSASYQMLYITVGYPTVMFFLFLFISRW